MTTLPQKQQANPSPNKKTNIISVSEPKRAFYQNSSPTGGANSTHKEGTTYQERSQKNDDVDTPGKEIGAKISTGVKIVGAVTGVAGIVAGSATAVAVGAAAIGGAIVYDQIRKE